MCFSALLNEGLSMPISEKVWKEVKMGNMPHPRKVRERESQAGDQVMRMIEDW